MEGVELSDLFAVAAGLMGTAAGVFLGGFLLDEFLLVVGRAVEGTGKRAQLISRPDLSDALKRRTGVRENLRLESASVTETSGPHAKGRFRSAPIAPRLSHLRNYSAIHTRSCLVDHIIQFPDLCVLKRRNKSLSVDDN